MVIVALVLTLIIAILSFLFIRKSTTQKQNETELKEIKNKFGSYKTQFKDIIDIQDAVDKKNAELSVLNKAIEDITAQFANHKEQLNNDFQEKRNIYQSLLNEISIIEEDLENISYGLYKPHFDYKTSEEYKQKLEAIWDQEKEMIKSDKATFCPTEWQVSGSKVEGRKMIKNQSKLMLRAFNGECDSAIAKVSWNNIVNIEARIKKAYEAINNLGSTQNIIITNEYANLKWMELRLEFELEEKIHQEKEEQRKIREQMREEEKALKEIEKARKEAEQEEDRYQKALDKAKAETNKSTGAELDALNKKIQQLEISLQGAKNQKERAISQAQLTKSGHVYIISNIGSFGEHVYKIGMTRRLEPLDRVYELGDASVPFDFDVHGMIYSENAPELEYNLHRRFDHKRLNLVNKRAEFFNITIEEIEEIVNDLNLKVELTKVAEAKEHRTSLSIREAKEKEVTQNSETSQNKELNKFPVSL